MKIVCATNMPFAVEAFSTLGEVRVLEGRTLDAAAVRDAEVLAVRSTTRVDRALLEGSRVRFVGTATIGTDHMDLDYLSRAGIAWCHAPGCNANSVSEYIVAALLCLGERRAVRLEGRTLGVVGLGAVGSRVFLKARALGMRVLACDPPRQCLAPPGRGETLLPGEGPALELGTDAYLAFHRLLSESDVITLHVPLTREGPDATWHMLDAGGFACVRPGAWVLNAARGPVVDRFALRDALNDDVLGGAVLDTWEPEPVFPLDLLKRATLATPHIAGHSFEGKAVGTWMVYRAACRFLGCEPAWTLAAAPWPGARVPSLTVGATGSEDEAVLRDVVRKVYDIEADDARMRDAAVPDGAERGRRFDALRRDYPDRREFPATTVAAQGGSPGLLRKLAGLGFRVSTTC